MSYLVRILNGFLFKGVCGIGQPAAHPFDYQLCNLGFCPISINADLSHGLCNEFYINAFEYDYLANNCFHCKDVLSPEDLPPLFKMGYMENRRR